MKTPWRWNKQDSEWLRRMGIIAGHDIEASDDPAPQADGPEQPQWDASLGDDIDSMPDSVVFIFPKPEVKKLVAFIAELRRRTDFWQSNAMLWKRVALVASVAFLGCWLAIIIASFARRYGW